MDQRKKQITKDLKLQAFALFTMAQRKYAESQVFQAELSRLLGYPDDDKYMGCLSDEIYDADGSFERGLRNEGFSLEPAKKRR